MFNPLDLTGRTILLTGGSSGIGLETAGYLSRLGARLILVSRSLERLMDAVSHLEGGGHLVLPCDVADPAAVASMMAQAAQAAGPLHGLIHCAGTMTVRPVGMLTSELIDQSLRTNVHSALSLAREFARRNVAAKPASLVYMTSVMALVGQPAQALYSAAKGAIVSLTKSLALELARQSIRVNCVAAGLVRAGMGEKIEKSLPPEQFARVVQSHPLGLGQPADVAAALAFLVSDASAWITGTTLVVDGGYTAH